LCWLYPLGYHVWVLLELAPLPSVVVKPGFGEVVDDPLVAVVAPWGADQAVATRNPGVAVVESWVAVLD
jgi:hypothetical protein